MTSESSTGDAPEPAAAPERPRAEAPGGEATGGARRSLPRRIAARFVPYLVPLTVSSAIGAWSVREILKRAGEPAMPLDDSFIHLQFARQIASGHLFQFVPGGGYSSGATSALWPSALAPAYWFGLDGLEVVWVVWALGTLLHAGTILETARLARGFAGRAGAIAAGAMCAVFGAFLWFAWSGMETMGLTWILVRTARVAAEACEGRSRRGPPPSLAQLLVLGLAAPLIRPEGVLASLMAVIGANHVLARRNAAHAPGRSRLVASAVRLVALVPLVGVLSLPVLNHLLVGHSASSTAMVKWLWLHPDVGLGAFAEATLDNVRLMLTSLMVGGGWTAIFMPLGIGVPVALGLFVLLRHTRRVPHRVVFVLLIAAGTFIPCTYDTMLWNRVRYMWPFAPAWFLALVCLSDGLGLLGERLWRPLRLATPIVYGAFAVAFAVKLPWARDDLAQSSRAISKQQVALGKWAAQKLPPEAIIGLNDTGALAYMSGRRTFDVVGLTTEGEAPYWVAGPGSRFEHYEQLPREKLPTHFVVYPQWMQCDPVLGRELTHRTVRDQSILGGATMTAYEASWSLLGSGAAPFRALPAGVELVDELDVADLESERGHRYARLSGRPSENLVQALAFQGSSRKIADGGRVNRPQDRFETELPAGQRILMVLRLGCAEPVEIWQDDVKLGVAEPPEDRGEGRGGEGRCWEERRIELPPSKRSRQAFVLHPADGRPFASYHYWFYLAPEG
ncbi:MAG: hypothetical protein IT373_23475 [Polyangiaceae bacterium]|nr:hypothetical protein [Polyangiaceae bacterium]